MNKPSSLQTGPLPSGPASFDGVFDRRRIRTLTDWSTRSVITAGGIGIIACILGMCVFLVKEVIPLFQRPEATLNTPVTLTPSENPASSVALVGIDEYRELAYVLRGNVLEFVRLRGDKSRESDPPPQSLFHHGTITAATRALGKGQYLALGTEDGLVLPVVIEFDQEFEDGERSISPLVTVGEPISVSPTPQAIMKMAY